MRSGRRDHPFKVVHVVGLIGALMLLGTLWAPVAAARPSCEGERATIVGTDRGDEIVGTRRADVIVSRGGKDTIRSRSGADVICSGDERDRVEASGGNDQVNGGEAQDRVDGGTGIDACLKAEVLVDCEADLDVGVQGPVKMVGNPPEEVELIYNNEVADWTFPYSNQGPSPAPGTTLTITFAPRLTVRTLDSDCSEEPVDTVTCQLGVLDVGEAGEVVISAESPGGCSEPQTDSFEVSAVIDASTRDHVPGDNTDSQPTAYTDVGC